MRETVEVDRASFRVMLMVAALEGRETDDACTEIADTLLRNEGERDSRLLLGDGERYRQDGSGA